MKKKSRSKNFEIIRDFLLKNGPTGAADIQKATNVRGNIYTKLQAMVNSKTIKKVGKLYQPTLDTAMKHDIAPQIKVPLYAKEISIYRNEIDNIDSGIRQLQITRNYLTLRIRELENSGAQKA